MYIIGPTRYSLWSPVIVLLGLQSRLGGKPQKKIVVCPENGNAVPTVLKGSRGRRSGYDLVSVR